MKSYQRFALFMTIALSAPLAAHADDESASIRNEFTVNEKVIVDERHRGEVVGFSSDPNTVLVKYEGERPKEVLRSSVGKVSGCTRTTDFCVDDVVIAEGRKAVVVGVFANNRVALSFKEDDDKEIYPHDTYNLTKTGKCDNFLGLFCTDRKDIAFQVMQSDDPAILSAKEVPVKRDIPEVEQQAPIDTNRQLANPGTPAESAQ